ncbi:MAG: hypothetical protein AB7O57_15040 [Hyphomicrobiaceae bacterium]
MTDATRAAQENVERARADLGETIDALKRKMSLGEIVNELQTQFFPSGTGGASGAMSGMARNFSRQVQDNPMALALIGAGVAWLMAGGSGGATRRYGSIHTGGATSRVSDAAHAAGETASDMTHRASSAAGSAMSSASDAVSGAGSTVSDAASRVADGASRGLHAAGETAASLQDQTMRMGEDMLQSHPLVLGALAVAVGAAIGAALPRTEVENRQMGEASDRMKDTLATKRDELVTRAEEVGSKVRDAAAGEVQASGLMPGAAGGNDKTTAEKVEKVGRAAARAVRDEVGHGSDPGSTATTDAKSPKKRSQSNP